jgi:hypothetical protein
MTIDSAWAEKETTMLAYHNDPTVKAFYLDRVRAHARADEIIHGQYWERGKGCAVGCTIHGSKHSLYETELGIPKMLARLEDRLFEGLQNGRSKAFPEQFLLAAKVGADLSRVGWKFLHWLLTEELASRDDPRVSAQIKRCADVLVPLTKGEPVNAVEARNAAAAADAAAADAAANAYAAANAADAAAYAAANAADAAAYAADAAANAANAAYAANAACAAYAAAYAIPAAYAADARSACYERMADKLLALMSECEGEPMRVAMGVVS